MQFCRYVYMHKDLALGALRYTQLNMQCEMAVSEIEEGGGDARSHVLSDNVVKIMRLCRLPARTNINIFTDITRYRSSYSVERGNTPVLWHTTVAESRENVNTIAPTILCFRSTSSQHFYHTCSA
jgi:hypothetical protein